MGEVSNGAQGLARKKEEAGCESYNETAGEGPIKNRRTRLVRQRQRDDGL